MSKVGEVEILTGPQNSSSNIKTSLKEGKHVNRLTSKQHSVNRNREGEMLVVREGTGKKRKMTEEDDLTCRNSKQHRSKLHRTVVSERKGKITNYFKTNTFTACKEPGGDPQERGEGVHDDLALGEGQNIRIIGSAAARAIQPECTVQLCDTDT